MLDGLMQKMRLRIVLALQLVSKVAEVKERN